MALLELEHLDKAFDRGAVRAVRDFSLSVERGDFVVLVGSSGCGKSTVLRLAAGLEAPDAGRVLLNGRDVTRARPAERDMAMVFQDYALYPHLTAFDNIAFPLKVRKVPRGEREVRVRAVAETLGIEGILDRKPPKLSGGQQQRVAIGRALVRNPALFLMDEPLSNLDAKLRSHMRGELARLHRTLGATVLYVTHDQVEAMTLATKIVVMDEGAAQQEGSPAELYLRPRTRFVAGFIGSPSMNFLECAVRGGMLRCGGGALPFPMRAGVALRRERRRLTLGVRPEHLALAEADAGGGVLAGRFARGEVAGADAYLHVDVAGTELVAKDDVRRLDSLRPGAPVLLRPNPDELFLFDPATGENLLLG